MPHSHGVYVLTVLGQIGLVGKRLLQHKSTMRPVVSAPTSKDKGENTENVLLVLFSLVGTSAFLIPESATPGSLNLYCSCY